MSLFYGLANGLPRPEMSPAELAPTSQNQNNWPSWGLHHETAGQAGEPPALPAAAELLRLYETWNWAENQAERTAAWQAMLAIHAEQVFSIGILGRAGQPVVARKDLRNLPKKAVYLYEPGAYFGIYRPDTFWIDAKP
jgi:peptide/nickel transport system substrate-binding protein